MESKDKLELMRTTVPAFVSLSTALRMWVTCKRSWCPLSEFHTYLVQDPEEFTNNLDAQQQTYVSCQNLQSIKMATASLWPPKSHLEP